MYKGKLNYVFIRNNKIKRMLNLKMYIYDMIKWARIYANNISILFHVQYFSNDSN